MARIQKSRGVAPTHTKVHSITSIKMALSVLALGFSALAAAAAGTTTPDKPDLIVKNLSFYNSGNGKTADLMFEVENIGPVATTRSFRILIQSSLKNDFGCGANSFGCVEGTRLREAVITTNPKTTAAVMVTPNSFSLQPNTSVMVSVKVPLVKEVSASRVQFAVTADSSGAFAELNLGNNKRALTVDSRALKTDQTYLPASCGGSTGYGYNTMGYGYNPVGCTDKAGSGCATGWGYSGMYGCYVPNSIGCPFGYGYNNSAGCILP